MDILSSYIKDRFKNVRKHLRSYLTFQDPESIHQYRVECKKIKAIYQLLKYSLPDFEVKNYYQKHRKLYRISGAVRDAQVIRELLLEHKLFIELPEEETILFEKNINRLIKKISSQIDNEAKLENQLKKYCHNITTIQLTQYITSLQLSISDLIKNPTSSESLHEIRKLIKTIKYLSDIYPEILHKKTQSTFNQLQEQIGSWHDKQVLIDYLEKIQPNYRCPIRKLEENSSKDLEKIHRQLKRIATA